MKIVISTGLSWLRVPVAINLFCKQLQAVNRQPSWSAFTKFKRDYSKYCIMYLTICYKSSSFAQFIQKWTVLSQNFWTFFCKIRRILGFSVIFGKKSFPGKNGAEKPDSQIPEFKKWPYWALLEKSDIFEKIGHFRLNWAFWLKA